MDSSTLSPWGVDWIWSLPLVAATVAIHVFGLGLIYRRVSTVLEGNGNKRRSVSVSSLIIGGAAFFATILHGLEGGVWAAAYILLGALHGTKTAMLFSLGAMTTFGHGDISLVPRWQLMGPLEALDGWILFGFTTAFLFSMIQSVWQPPDRPR
jgi:hypothetical protein